MMRWGSVVRSPAYLNASDHQRHMAMRDARKQLQADKYDYDLVDLTAYWLAWLALCLPVYLTSYWRTALPAVLVAGFWLVPFPFLWPIDVRVVYRRFRYNYYFHEALAQGAPP